MHHINIWGGTIIIMVLFAKCTRAQQMHHINICGGTIIIMVLFAKCTRAQQMHHINIWGGGTIIIMVLFAKCTRAQQMHHINFAKSVPILGIATLLATIALLHGHQSAADTVGEKWCVCATVSAHSLHSF